MSVGLSFQGLRNKNPATEEQEYRDSTTDSDVKYHTKPQSPFVLLTVCIAN